MILNAKYPRYLFILCFSINLICINFPFLICIWICEFNQTLMLICRNYYRCTHKYDQGCQATKQVQRIQEEPPLFRTTYYGNHTCRNLLNPEIILDSESPSNSSVFLSFDNTIQSKQDLPFLTSSFPSVKKEFKEEIADVQGPQNQSSTSDNYLVSPELTFDSSNLESDHRDVISSVLYESEEIDVFKLIESSF